MLIFYLSSILSLCPQLHHYSPTPSLPPLLLNFAILIIRRVNLTTHFKLQRDPPPRPEKKVEKKEFVASNCQACCVDTINRPFRLVRTNYRLLSPAAAAASTKTTKFVCSYSEELKIRSPEWLVHKESIGSEVTCLI